MTSNWTVIAAAVALAALLGLDAESAALQSSPRTVWSGVFSAAQAKRGEAIVSKRCATCHNSDLGGGQDGPALVGADALRAWSNTTAGDLFDRIRTTMPADAPQSLSPQETADIVAFILSQNKCPAGDNELPAEIEALKQIQITPGPNPDNQQSAISNQQLAITISN
ncbi:MAG TPA: cytochrome c [Vicinamibacterales bacterium]|nr:cytochrome c [Vicinamibacterales bacterium]